ncbi:Primosome assembly protein PriA [Lysobacter dokdonensis DS-58]|uniref:Replication restart protein PriA n=1 Tax=Lysobacter dokdonensis DS-58 TaxID=1300345 RepID=A0A0A2WGK1_9GAMM|nr:primosomal protein N' [Lysobacter dokdonensis]KGQ17832.1 Primosome assembly protein PriA [Lysobacter dokdonensis DS-58]
MSSDDTVLRVALPVPLARLFDYRAPEGVDVEAVPVGARVRVMFGPRELIGVVAGTGPIDTAARETKAALAVLDTAPVLQGELLDSLRWLARYVHAPLGEVLATALPAALRQGGPMPDTDEIVWRPVAGASFDKLKRGAMPQRLAELLSERARTEDELDDALPGWRTAARALATKGLAEPIRTTPGRDAVPGTPGPVLNDEQRAAVDAITAHDGFGAVLLEGVTGSGKTEVYLQAIADCLARGKQALVLVPEIGLTPQTLARFRARLGIDVHALHSGLNDTARARVWAAASRGQARVIVGTRSAIFTPLPAAGLIVVDEEHDGSYKQQDGIRYHARDFALVRGKALDVPVVLGSATPSLETLHNAQAGRYTHVRLSKRAGDAKPPAVRVLDIRKRALDAGLSPELLAKIRATVDAGGQVLVFRNRRGYAPVLLCHDCGWSAACKRCSTPDHPHPMTVHAGGRRLQCHHCGARQPAPMACPDCGGLALQPQGVGTERIEERLVELFTDVPVLRVDRGSTRRRDALESLLAQLGDRPGILVGTQMLAKGHDLPNLTLVAVVGIDEGLFSADFRAGEKLAQLLIQVAGRAGRARRAGEVWLQTHHPAHPLLQTLIAGGYRAFADGALAEREAAGFPPFAHLALMRAEAKSAEPNARFLALAKSCFDDAGIADVDVHGPLPAPMPRRAGFQRAQLLVSAPHRRALHAALDATLPRLRDAPEGKRVRWSLDVDPIDLY